MRRSFSDDSYLELTPELVGPSTTRNEGIIGEGVDLNLVHTGDLRRFILSCFTSLRDCSTPSGAIPTKTPKLHLFGRLKGIVKTVAGRLPSLQRRGTYPAQLRYQDLADRACEIITAAITNSRVKGYPVKATARFVQPDRLNRTRELQHVQDEPLEY